MYSKSHEGQGTILPYFGEERCRNICPWKPPRMEQEKEWAKWDLSSANGHVLEVVWCFEQAEPRQSRNHHCSVFSRKMEYMRLCNMCTLLGIVWSGFSGSKGALCALAGASPPLNVRSASLLLWTTPSRLALSASSLQNVQITPFILTRPLWEGWVNP